MISRLQAQEEPQAPLRAIIEQLRTQPRIEALASRIAFLSQPQPLNPMMADRLLASDSVVGPFLMKSLAHAIDVAGKPVPASMGEAMQSLSVRTSHVLLLAGCLRIWATLLASKSEFPVVPYVYQSAAQAVSASRLANPKEPEAADAAIGAGALLHFGVPFMVLAFGADYVNIWKNLSRPGMTLAEAEFESFGFTHADASAIALEAFGFPATVIAAAKSHERPPSELRGAEQAIAVGANLAENMGFDGETGRVRPELPTTWLIRLGLKESDKDNLAAQIRDVLNLILP